MSKEDEPVIQTCRSCLSSSTDMYPIFKTILQDNIKTVTMLNYFSIEIAEDDALLKTICHSCLLKLQQAYSFIETFKKSQELLLQLQKSEENVVMLSDGNTFEDDVEDSNTTEENSDFLNNQMEEGTESFLITYEENESDDQDFLIEQSVKLTAKYKLHKLDTEYADTDSDNSRETEDDKTEENQNVKNGNSLKSPSLVALPCPICSKTFKRYCLLYDHIKTHNSEIECKRCSMWFNDANVYIKHYQSTHKHQCNICEKSFPRRDAYTRHMRAHNNTLIKFTCPSENCTKTFSGRHSLRSHYLTVHSENRNYLCSLCGASFKNYDNLRYHMKKHNGPSHLCTYCGKKFMQSTHLKTHMWRHTGVKPHKCTKCDRTFVSNNILKHHLRKHCGEILKRTRRQQLFVNIESN